MLFALGFLKYSINGSLLLLFIQEFEGVEFIIKIVIVHRYVNKPCIMALNAVVRRTLEELNMIGYSWGAFSMNFQIKFVNGFIDYVNHKVDEVVFSLIQE